MTRQKAQISWSDDDLPVSVRFDDPYFSKVDGLAETRHVFLAGNDLPARFSDGFTIAELGFGTGLNFLATLQMWRETGQSGTLHFTSFEAFPMDKSDMARGDKKDFPVKEIKRKVNKEKKPAVVYEVSEVGKYYRISPEKLMNGVDTVEIPSQ